MITKLKGKIVHFVAVVFTPWAEDRKGVGVVVAMIAVTVAILIGLIIAANLQSVANGFALGTVGNATRTALFNTLWNSYNLLVVMLIVMAAAAILSAISWIHGKSD